MRVEQRSGRGERHFVIMLDKEDAFKLLGMDSLYGCDRDSGISFRLYSQLNSSQNSFVPMPPNLEGYQYTMGCADVKGPKDLVRSLQDRGRFPIESLPVEEGRDPVNVGYVTFEFRPRAKVRVRAA